MAACSEDFHGGDDFDWDASEAVEKIAIVEKVYHKCFQNKNLPVSSFNNISNFLVAFTSWSFRRCRV